MTIAGQEYQIEAPKPGTLHPHCAPFRATKGEPPSPHTVNVSYCGESWPDEYIDETDVNIEERPNTISTLLDLRLIKTVMGVLRRVGV